MESCRVFLILLQTLAERAGLIYARGAKRLCPAFENLHETSVLD